MRQITTAFGEVCGSYPEYLDSQWWLWLRWAILTKVKGHCDECGATTRLQVHHLSYANIGNEAPEDLTVLCRACHAKGHGKRQPGTPITLGEGLAERLKAMESEAHNS